MASNTRSSAAQEVFAEDAGLEADGGEDHHFAWGSMPRADEQLVARRTLR
ncbi:MAG: hypothetical protein U0P45_08390 [Acidimicrobiales bacterium]